MKFLLVNFALGIQHIKTMKILLLHSFLLHLSDLLFSELEFSVFFYLFRVSTPTQGISFAWKMFVKTCFIHFNIFLCSYFNFTWDFNYWVWIIHVESERKISENYLTNLWSLLALRFDIPSSCLHLHLHLQIKLSFVCNISNLEFEWKGRRKFRDPFSC